MGLGTLLHKPERDLEAVGEPSLRVQSLMLGGSAPSASALG
jgi:hypothetical protein